jgi:uncharacterized protein
MYYVDTSVIVAYYCPEPLSNKAEAFLTTHTHLVISSLTEAEMFSALSKKVRDGGVSKVDASRVAAQFLAHVDGRFYSNVPLDQRHYRLARDWVGGFDIPLRTLDALHLAIASSEGLVIVTADQGLAKSAKALALDTVLLK